jgi:hypothetical protein
MCLPPLVARPDLDSSQDSRKVSHARDFSKKPKIDKVIEDGKIYSLWIVTTIEVNQILVCPDNFINEFAQLCH